MAIGAILVIPVALIFLQNDTGSALVFAVFSLVLYREGLSGVILFLGLLIAIVFILTLILHPLITISIITVSAIVVYYFINPKFVLSLKAIGISASIFMTFWLTNTLLRLNIDTNIV